ncbi:hypothetical protein P153DRAFT_302102 [Dothidotthia symphoricarpi CBS 119687]|uniref:Uncharacterized protein n=1 Tax=Dothidotthia symphoricarpi CBS 119687 TaxID=1392245 RepID=A0A6A6A1G1_9PLEO|nr:uncharacterized protein P153DRAFT_302102 [Dothidotthia symphoricarpi CBS 119687]KAF2124558.1 hypothetical protein P153DRAFT_302102 [Dothidotthia symphoricarpi CBS 119687]
MHQFRSKAKTQQQKKGAKQQKEDIILQKRLEYIKTLPVERAQDYRLTITLLSSAFRTSPHNTSSSHKRWVFDWGGGIDGPRQIRKGESWLTWFILSEGPDLFWNQWQDPSHAREHYIRDRAIAVWEQTNKDLVDYQRGQAKQVVEALNERACIETQFERVNLSLYFREYAELRFKREREEGVDEIRDTTGDVWFFVEFQWPEELRRMGELEEEWRVERGSVR